MKIPIVLTCLLAAAVAASAYFKEPANFWPGDKQKPTVADSGTTPDAQPSCAIATEQQAAKLMIRLFPESLILSAEPYVLNGSTCLLEVYMQVDKNEPGTKGFVYVLPDGDHFLNGPLMDKRSDVGLKVASDVDQIKAARAEQANAIQQRQTLIGTPPIPSASTQAASGSNGSVETTPPLLRSPEQMRQDMLADLSALPALTTGNPGKPVYALVDPLCGACTQLYNQSSGLAEKYGMQFHWIPLFTSDKGWVMSALLLKTAKTDKVAALNMLDSMMRRTWKDADYKPQIAALTPEDYAESKRSFTVYYEFAKAVPGARTPLVAYNTPDAGIQVFAGLPIDSDWLPLLGSTPPAPQVQQ